MLLVLGQVLVPVQAGLEGQRRQPGWVWKVEEVQVVVELLEDQEDQEE